MQILTRADGTVEGIGSINHAELAKARAAAKKRKSSDTEQKTAEPQSPGPDLPKSEGTSGPTTESGPPKPATTTRK